VLSAVAAAAVMVAAGAPFLSVNSGENDPRTLPVSFESRQVADTLMTRFPSTQADPIQIVAERRADDPAVLAYAAKLTTMPGVTAVAVNDSLPGNLSVTSVIAVGETQGPAAQRVVDALRADRPSYPPT